MRHLTEMERVYGTWALGPEEPLVFVWGDYTDDDPEWDIDADASMAEASRAAWANERRLTDERISGHQSLAGLGGNGRTVRWNVQKLVGEYARHNGHADLIRERIDGRTGE
jgi:hypothetical protein